MIRWSFHWYCDRSWHKCEGRWIGNRVGWPAWVWPCGWARAPPPRPSPCSPRPSCWRCWSPTAVTWDTASMPCSSGRFVANIVISRTSIKCQCQCQSSMNELWTYSTLVTRDGSGCPLPHLNCQKDFTQNEARIAAGCTCFSDTVIVTLTII